MRFRRSFLRGFAAVIVLAGLGVGGWLWLRDSSLVARDRGARHRGDARATRRASASALESAARDMTTLHVREDILRRRGRRYPSVAGLRVETDFPHKLSIEVLEHRPVAALDDRRAAHARSPAAGSCSPASRPTATCPRIRRDQPPGARVDRRADAGRARRRRRGAAAAPGAQRAPVVGRRGPDARPARRPAARLRHRATTPPPSGPPRPACSPSRAPPARPISTSACPAGWPPEGSVRSPRSPRRKTLNLRVRIGRLSIRSRDFGVLQRRLPTFAPLTSGTKSP